MAAATLSPSPKQFFWNVITGAPLAGGLVYTVTAGGSFPGSAIATYQDSAALIPNSNPILLNAAGYATIYLQPGKTYKYIATDANGALQYTQDGIEAVPTANLGQDVSWTAGDTFTIGQAAYLSDGSGGKVAGQAYLADSANAYSSTSPLIGVATAAIASGSTGNFRQGGIVSGLSGLIAGAKYYVGTAGALTSTIVGRLVGVADNTTTQLDVAANPPQSIEAWVNDFRLTLTTGVPVTTTDVTAATTVLCSPYLGNRIDLPDGSGNPVRFTSAEFSIAVPASTSQMYDIFVYNNSGTPTLELLAWTNDTTRATTVVRTTNGRLLKSGDNTRMYLASFRTTTVSGQTEDSVSKRYLWNYYNRVRRRMQRFEGSVSWNYTTATIRQANGSAANQVAAVIGIAEVLAEIDLYVNVYAITTAAAVQIGVGVNVTNAFSANNLGGQAVVSTGGSTTAVQATCAYRDYPAVGLNNFAWCEWSAASGGTTTWNGITASATTPASNGMQGWIDG